MCCFFTALFVPTRSATETESVHDVSSSVATSDASCSRKAARRGLTCCCGWAWEEKARPAALPDKRDTNLALRDSIREESRPPTANKEFPRRRFFRWLRKFWVHGLSMPKASPSKAPLPKKPREPKEVNDVALNTMRVAADNKIKIASFSPHSSP